MDAGPGLLQNETAKPVHRRVVVVKTVIELMYTIIWRAPLKRDCAHERAARTIELKPYFLLTKRLSSHLMQRPKKDAVVFKVRRVFCVVALDTWNSMYAI